jgi:hypothetical protein
LRTIQKPVRKAYVNNPLRGTRWLAGEDPADIDWEPITPAPTMPTEAALPAPRARDGREMAPRPQRRRRRAHRSGRTHSELAHTSVGKDGR